MDDHFHTRYTQDSILKYMYGSKYMVILLQFIVPHSLLFASKYWQSSDKANETKLSCFFEIYMFLLFIWTMNEVSLLAWFYS